MMLDNQRNFLSEYMPELLELEVPQFELLTEGKFVDFLRARDVRIGKEDLEHYEKVGFLYPILRLKRPLAEENGPLRYSGIMSSSWYLKNYLKAGMLELPTQENFRPWSTYVEKGGEENTFIFYHPYQIFLVERFVNVTRVILSSDYLEEGIDFEKMSMNIKEMHKHLRQAFLNTRPRLIKQIGLLLQLQNAYQPYYRGALNLAFGTDSFERFRIWREQVFSPSVVLKNSNLSLEEVAELRDYFAMQGQFNDPVGNWYPLVRLIPFRRKERLKGKALLAQDHYEIVYILNYFLKDLTGVDQPEPDDIVDGRHGEWKSKYYGRKFSYKDEEIRRKIVSDYLHVTIPKVVLLVEGDTEETAINLLMEGFGRVPEQEGIAIHNFEGTGGIGLGNASAVLGVAKKQKIGGYLIVDNEEPAPDWVEVLVNKLLLLEKDNFTIWTRNFEEDNYTIDSIIEIVNERLNSYSLEPLSGQQVEERKKTHPNEPIWKAIQTLNWFENHTELDSVITKKSLTQILCRNRANQIQKEIHENNYKPKFKIEEEILKIHKIFCE